MGFKEGLQFLFRNPVRLGELGQIRPYFNYSEAGAEFSLAIEPFTRKGPMAIDSRLFTKADSYTKLGAKRNGSEFWKLWNKRYPETISNKNVEWINKNKAPKVDEHWIRHFPEHKNYLGQGLDHHHLEHGSLCVPLPKDLHRGPGNSLKWHHKGGKE